MPTDHDVTEPNRTSCRLEPVDPETQEQRNEAHSSGIPDVDGMRILSGPEILNGDPNTGDAPTPVVSRVCYEGRLTLLAAREKVGKSTFATAVAAAVATGGEFLGAPCKQGMVVWLRLEEAVGDLFRRLKALASDSQLNDFLVADQIQNPVQSFAGMIQAVQPKLVVVDTLTDWAALHDEHPQSGDSAGWNQILKGLCDPVRDSGTAVLVLHHASKKGGARDSTAIAAKADLVLEMRVSGDTRKITSMGRWDTDDIKIQLDGDTYTLLEPLPPLADRIVAFLQSEGPSSKTEIRDGVRGRNESIDEALESLLYEERVIAIRNGERILFVSPARWDRQAGGVAPASP